MISTTSASRRVRFVGELLQQKIRVGMSQMKRNIQDRMSTIESETTLAGAFVNRHVRSRPASRNFSPPTSSRSSWPRRTCSPKLEHLRTLSALGPGGLTRERAGFEVRDVHPSHYGRLCPIHTPEGPNIGLILRLATYAKLNEFGMIETPYARSRTARSRLKSSTSTPSRKRSTTSPTPRPRT
jgi:DNA-directed RNA polymerase subunit beta